MGQDCVRCDRRSARRWGRPKWRIRRVRTAAASPVAAKGRCGGDVGVGFARRRPVWPRAVMARSWRGDGSIGRGMCAGRDQLALCDRRSGHPALQRRSGERRNGAPTLQRARRAGGVTAAGRSRPSSRADCCRRAGGANPSRAPARSITRSITRRSPPSPAARGAGWGLDGGWIPSRDQDGGMEGNVAVVATGSVPAGQQGRHRLTPRRSVAPFASSAAVRRSAH